MGTAKYPSELKQTIEQLACESSYGSVCHKHLHDKPMPSTQTLRELVDLLREILFPGYFGHSEVRTDSIHYYLGVNTERAFNLTVDQVHAGLCFICSDENIDDSDVHRKLAYEMATKFISQLPDLRKTLATDVEVAFIGDPAAQSRGEVIFCYPAIRAITNYRIAHALLQLGVPLIPRMISEMAHSETGIDIHPAAQIGSSFTIDHGTGVVIGATSIIGRNVKLFQGVTLGAKNFQLDEHGNPIKGIARHPIVEDNVVIYAQATILGRITVGAGSIIGGNVWVTSDVAPGSKIVQFKPKEALYSDGSGI
jgi:serine O-acetyltransferase